MGTRLTPAERVPNTTRRYPRRLVECPPYARSESLYITSATAADAAELHSARRAEAAVMLTCIAAIAALIAFELLGWLP